PGELRRRRLSAPGDVDDAAVPVVGCAGRREVCARDEGEARPGPPSRRYGTHEAQAGRHPSPREAGDPELPLAGEAWHAPPSNRRGGRGAAGRAGEPDRGPHRLAAHALAARRRLIPCAASRGSANLYTLRCAQRASRSTESGSRSRISLTAA